VIRVPYEKTVIERVQAPADLLEDCQDVDTDHLETNSDLERALGEAVVSLDACTEDKRRLRDWQESE